MKIQQRRCWLVCCVLAAFLMASLAGSAQSDTQVQAVKQALSGQKVLLTYREGGPIYGTYYFLTVHMCRSGTYMTIGQSRKQTILNNEQINNWRDQGTWTVVAVAGQVGVRSVSVSGRMNFVPVRILPDGGIAAGNGISVVQQGAAQCR